MSGLTGAKTCLALNRLSRRNSNSVPWTTFVPDFVTAFTVAPEWTPFSAESPLVATRNSCNASGNGSGMPRLSYGVVVRGAIEQVRHAERKASGHARKDRARHALVVRRLLHAAPASTIKSVTWRP